MGPQKVIEDDRLREFTNDTFSLANNFVFLLNYPIVEEYYKNTVDFMTIHENFFWNVRKHADLTSQLMIHDPKLTGRSMTFFGLRGGDLVTLANLSDWIVDKNTAYEKTPVSFTINIGTIISLDTSTDQPDGSFIFLGIMAEISYSSIKYMVRSISGVKAFGSGDSIAAMIAMREEAEKRSGQHLDSFSDDLFALKTRIQVCINKITDNMYGVSKRRVKELFETHLVGLVMTFNCFQTEIETNYWYYTIDGNWDIPEIFDTFTPRDMKEHWSSGLWEILIRKWQHRGHRGYESFIETQLKAFSDVEGNIFRPQ